MLDATKWKLLAIKKFECLCIQSHAERCPEASADQGLQVLVGLVLFDAECFDLVFFDVVGTSPKHLRIAIDAIGSDRIMFGSDWSATWRWLSEPAPLYTIRKNVLKAANLSKEEKENILWKTADNVFKLNIAN